MSDKARKLLERMRQSPKNWERSDLEALYLGFDFEIKHGSKHDIAWHPKYPQLQSTLPRHKGTIATGWVRQAIKIIDELEKLETNGGDDDEHQSENES